jgi:hypothetical protein
MIAYGAAGFSGSLKGQSSPSDRQLARVPGELLFPQPQGM